MTELRQYLRTISASKQASGMRLPVGLTYVGLEDYVADRSVPPTTEALTPDEWEAIYTAVEGAGGTRRVSKMKQCFANAQQVVLADSSGLLSYGEGFALGAAQFPLHHGWVVVNDKVVDLTWRNPAPSRGRLGGHVLGLLPPDWVYCGVLFERDDVVRNVRTTGFFQSLIDDWRGGWPLLKQPRLQAGP